MQPSGVLVKHLKKKVLGIRLVLEILKLRLKNILMILNDKRFLNPDGRGHLCLLGICPLEG